jgi:hypothetical protein
VHASWLLQCGSGNLVNWLSFNTALAVAAGTGQVIRRMQKPIFIDSLITAFGADMT